MKHGLALLLKVALVIAVFHIMLTSLNHYPLSTTILLAILTAGISYLLGDLLILPISNNLVATLADLGLASGILWLIGSFLYGMDVPLQLAIWTGVLLAVGEWFFHLYMTYFVHNEEQATIFD